MIKNLLEQDENQPGEIKSGTEKSVHDSAFERVADSHFSEANETENLYEIPEITIDTPSDLETSEAANAELPAETKIEESHEEINNRVLFQAAAEPESIAETARKSGLAYGAAITLFGSIVFRFASWNPAVGNCRRNCFGSNYRIFPILQNYFANLQK